MDFKNRKVLVMGLGLLGGGVAATRWLVRHGAKVTVTDLRQKKELASSIKALGPGAAKVRFVLGKHRIADFKNNEIIIVNPAVPRDSKYLKIAKKAGVELENEASIFFRICRNPIIGVTGTRGKTTTANWLYRILKKKYRRAVLTGNSSENPMLGVLDKLDGKNPVVVELSSWHLEFLPRVKKSPRIAIITNIYPDHLNRYQSMRSYASAKASIFKYQNKKDRLILNRGNEWTKFFLKMKPKAGISYFPGKLPVDKKEIIRKYGLHNFENMAAAVLAAKAFGLPGSLIKSALKSLPELKYRQEAILEKKNLTVINDTTATTPEAGQAALRRFAPEKGPFGAGRGALILITGGTDKRLDFSGWAKTVKKLVGPENLYLLEGSATRKMVEALKKIGYFRKVKPQTFDNLAVLVKSVNKKPRAVILFSPSATSFEKFKNEFDRGEQFSRLAEKHLG
ncbi:MAG: UDP-N-acetylmuramoyl-L-alanine--D-glutamate ligase [Candidatus Jorgensenbacteria bacterium]